MFLYRVPWLLFVANKRKPFRNLHRTTQLTPVLLFLNVHFHLLRVLIVFTVTRLAVGFVQICHQTTGDKQVDSMRKNSCPT